MNRFTLFAAISTATLSLVACRPNETDVVLLHAEQLMETHPDSALALLEHYAPTTKPNKKQQADYGLLITQARDKNYAEHTSDSLVRLAADFYEKHRDPHRLMLCYYYIGNISSDLNNPSRAQDYYYRAYSVCRTITDSTYTGKICNNLGMIYVYQNLYDLALPFLKTAAECFRNDPENHALALCDIARCFHMLQKLDSTVCLLPQSPCQHKRSARAALYDERIGWRV